MPTYDYECTQCGHRFEKFQAISDPLVESCPECGGPVKRMIGTGAGLHFKGGGFYITENRSSGYKEKQKAESGGGESKPTSEKAEKKDKKETKEPKESKEKKSSSGDA